MELIIDDEIRSIIPEPETVLKDDQPKIGSDGNENKDWNPTSERLNNLEKSIAANPGRPVQILVWKGKGIIVDGIERYRICQKLGIEPLIAEMEFRDKAHAMLERWSINVKIARHLNDFLRAEKVYRLWDKVFKKAKTELAKLNKGGRGKRVDPASRVDQLGEQAKMAVVSRTQMGYVKRCLDYIDNPKSRMPKGARDESLRCLRNGTASPKSVANSFVGWDERATRQEKNSGARLPKSSKPSRHVKTCWTGESNVVICSDALEILKQIPCEAVDRFVFSPPYYLCDASGNYINYGENYKPFESWDHYCNWTLRYLVEMWRILPRGGYIVVNVDNTREPSKLAIKDANGKKIGEAPNPWAGLFYYHTDMIRLIMRDILLYARGVDFYERDHSINPTIPDIGDPPPVFSQRLIGENAVDCGEYIWAKSQVVAKRSATGSRNDPQRRPNHEYVMFFRKGKEEPKASLMREKDLAKGTISSWEDWEALDHFEQGIFNAYMQIPAAPDHNSEYAHPAPFPKKLAFRMITQGAGFGDVICDPFCGKGTTLYVAARRGFQYIGIEQNPSWAARAQREARAGEAAFEAEQRQNLVSR